MKTIAFYLAIVLVIAVPLAFFEIWLERFKTGWGGNFRPGTFWGTKLKIEFLRRLVGEDMVTPYHLITFLCVVPALYAIVLYLLSPRMAHGRIVWPIFIVACQLGIMMVEDALLFSNWRSRMRFPASYGETRNGILDGLSSGS